ncbi:DUF707 domain-containing protein [Nocardia salmonicida]|uniref:DUF707 domain-containing protein n=1 Tax=Nocardia salmonicida TaxID=53431 RepID=UPI003678E98D
MTTTLPRSRAETSTRTQPVATRRRNLVVLRAGDTSLHEQWLAGPPPRTWDLVISYFGADRDRYRIDEVTRIDRKGPKWPALHHVLTVDLVDVIDEYDYIWLPDDDLATDTATINELFECVARYRLSLAQPALTEDSFFSHEITLVDRRFELRHTNFVEIMAPCFSRDFLKRCLPTFAGTQTGWGLDFHWPRFIDDSSSIAILDSVTVRHTRPVGGPNYAAVRAVGVDPWSEYCEYLATHEISDLTPRVYRGLGDAASHTRGLESTAVCVTINRWRPELTAWFHFHCAQAELIIVYTNDPEVRTAVNTVAGEQPVLLRDNTASHDDPIGRELADIIDAVDTATRAGMRWLLPLGPDELFYDDGRRRWQIPGAGQVTFIAHEAVPSPEPVTDPIHDCTLFRRSGRSPFLDTPVNRSAVRLGPGVAPVDEYGFTGFDGLHGTVTAPMILHYPYPSFDRWLARAEEVAEIGGAKARHFAHHSRELLQVAVAHGELSGARACFQAAIPSDGMVDRMLSSGELMRIEPLRAMRDSAEVGSNSLQTFSTNPI